MFALTVFALSLLCVERATRGHVRMAPAMTTSGAAHAHTAHTTCQLQSEEPAHHKSHKSLNENVGERIPCSQTILFTGNADIVARERGTVYHCGAAEQDVVFINERQVMSLQGGAGHRVLYKEPDLLQRPGTALVK